MTPGTGLRRRERLEVPVRSEPRERLSPGCRLFRGQGFEAFITEDVIERMLYLGRAQAPNEWMGLLLGHVGEDGSGAYVVVRAVLFDSGALGAPHSIESTHQSEARTRSLARLLFPDLVSLGWGHGHLVCGAQFSAKDFETQATWTAPYALGVVVDPWDPKELAVFRGPEGERLEAVPQVAETLPPSRPQSDETDERCGASGVVRSRLPRVVKALSLFVLVLVGVSSIAVAIVLAYRLHLRVRLLEERHLAVAPPREVAELRP